LGWRVHDSNVFTETYTGEDLFERPALTRLHQAVARGDVQAVLFYEVDRFARDPIWIEMVTQECIHFGAQVAFVRGGDDLGQDTLKAPCCACSRATPRQLLWRQVGLKLARACPGDAPSSGLGIDTRIGSS